MTTLEHDATDRDLTPDLTPADLTPADLTRVVEHRQLRIATAGSVDDGKSTLIGRLLHDTKTIFEDQLDAVVRASRRYGDHEVNLALLTDGLRAEREQGITIDVAYRYFATPTRSFVLADTPGHVQYTRNMVTGASVADVAIVLVDARHGVVEQTRRHLGIASLLGVRHVVVAVNKMDLVDWDREAFARVVTDVCALVDELGAASGEVGAVRLLPIPVSALLGDNVVDVSVNTPWYDGPSLLDLLETIDLDDAGHDDRATVAVGARLAVQWVIRAGSDYRGYAGPLTGGALSVGDAIAVLPSGLTSIVSGITRGGDPVEHALPGDAIAVSLADHVDVGRGDVLAVFDSALPPAATTEIVADVCWMIDEPVHVGSRFVAKHLARQVTATVTGIMHRLDPDTLAPVATDTLALNDLGRVRVVFAEPIVADRYVDEPSGGRLVLVDPVTNATAGALIVREIIVG